MTNPAFCFWPAMARFFRLAALIVVSTTALLIAAGGSRAEEQRLDFELDEGRRIAYELDLEVPYPGTLAVVAEWPGLRTLSFKLRPQNGLGSEVSRSGPPPQRLEAQVRQASPERPSLWKLKVYGLAQQGGGVGTLRVLMPDPPAPDPVQPAVATGTPETPSARIGSRFQPSATVTPEDLEFLAAGMRLEQLTAGGVPDTCRWQDGLLGYLQRFVPSQTAQAYEGDPETRRALRDMVAAIQAVEAVRVSDDPLITGPGPADPVKREAWLRVREKELFQVKQRLDRLLHTLRRNRAGSLSQESWPARLVSCIAACERHFDERGLQGETRATNYELAQNQWDRILAASGALDRALTLIAVEAETIDLGGAR